jgi:RNA polymerase sigma-70 factor (ECF subfamily)
MSRDPEQIEQAIRDAHARQDFERAATLLVEAYGREVLAFLVSRLRDSLAAQEVFSIFAEDLWRGLPGFAFRCPSRIWAYAVARHAASRYRKAAARERRRNIPLSLAPSVAKIAQRARSETAAALKTERKEKLAALRARLAPHDQTLLLLRVQRKLEFRDIAQVTLHGSTEPDAAAIERETARLRKRFQMIKERLHKLAEAEGLIARDE